MKIGRSQYVTLKTGCVPSMWIDFQLQFDYSIIMYSLEVSNVLCQNVAVHSLHEELTRIL